MPLLNIHTNMSLKSEAKDELLNQASKMLSEILEKHELYIMVNIQSGKHMQFAGTTDLCACVEFKSIELDEDKTSEYSDAICKMLHAKLGIEPKRIYIEFVNAKRHMWGWNRGTFLK